MTVRAKEGHEGRRTPTPTRIALRPVLDLGVTVGHIFNATAIADDEGGEARNRMRLEQRIGAADRSGSSPHLIGSLKSAQAVGSSITMIGTVMNTAINRLQDPAALIGRTLLALMFVLSAFGKMGAFPDTTGYMASALWPGADPWLEFLLIVTILVELGGGTAIIVGWKTRSAAVLVFLFTATVTLVFHRFWEVAPAEAVIQQTMFMKNLSVMGGLLLLFAFGPGAYALDGNSTTGIDTIALPVTGR